MKKFFLNILIVLFLFIFIHKPVTSQELIPKPGISCGIGTSEENIDINLPENSQYRCCYSLIENFQLDLKNPFEGEGWLLESTIGKVFVFLKSRINNFPFVFWPFPGNAPFSLAALTDLNKSLYENNRCERGSTMVGELGKDCFCRKGESLSLESLVPFCKIINENERQNCFDCIGYDPNTNRFSGKGGVYTGIGCVPGDLGVFIKEKVFGWGVGLAGIIALFCIIYAAFQIQTSQGSPEKIKKAQELLTSCIMGLMLIIFSVFILKLIGVDILRIPGFGR